MLEKLKTHVLIVVAVLLAYSGWSRGQDPEDVAGLLDIPDVLPSVPADSLSHRAPGEELALDFDPFRMAERMDARDRGDEVIEDRGPVGEAVEDAGEAPMLELQSVIARPSQQSLAFINGRHYEEGARMGVADGVLVEVRRIAGPEVTVRYLEKDYTMHLYDFPRLSLLRTKAKLIADLPEETLEGAAEGPPVQQP